MSQTIIIGFGNTDRQDDGAAWHVLATLRHLLGKPGPETSDEVFEPHGDNPDFLFTIQLTPELAETLVNYSRVCFVDVHTGSVPEDIHLRPVKVEYQRSPLTHHMTPDTLLALCMGLYNQTPEAILVSVRGYQFGFERSLSPQTQALIEPAAQQIRAWLSLN
jgi:hydrogenase maturation protease